MRKLFSERLKRFIKMLERSIGLSRSLKSVITSIMFHMIIWQMNLTTEIFKSERNWIRFRSECNYSFSYNY